MKSKIWVLAAIFMMATTGIAVAQAAIIRQDLLITGDLKTVVDKMNTMLSQDFKIVLSDNAFVSDPIRVTANAGTGVDALLDKICTPYGLKWVQDKDKNGKYINQFTISNPNPTVSVVRTQGPPEEQGGTAAVSAGAPPTVEKIDKSTPLGFLRATNASLNIGVLINPNTPGVQTVVFDTFFRVWDSLRIVAGGGYNLGGWLVYGGVNYQLWGFLSLGAGVIYDFGTKQFGPIFAIGAEVPLTKGDGLKARVEYFYPPLSPGTSGVKVTVGYEFR